MIINHFNAFITIDNNISFQNNFSHYPIAVIVLIAQDNTYETIMEFFGDIISFLKNNFIGSKNVIHPNYQQ